MQVFQPFTFYSVFLVTLQTAPVQCPTCDSAAGKGLQPFHWERVWWMNLRAEFYITKNRPVFFSTLSICNLPLSNIANLWSQSHQHCLCLPVGENCSKNSIINCSSQLPWAHPSRLCQCKILPLPFIGKSGRERCPGSLLRVLCPTLQAVLAAPEGTDPTASCRDSSCLRPSWESGNAKDGFPLVSPPPDASSYNNS